MGKRQRTQQALLLPGNSTNPQGQPNKKKTEREKKNTGRRGRKRRNRRRTGATTPEKKQERQYRKQKKKETNKPGKRGTRSGKGKGRKKETQKSKNGGKKEQNSKDMRRKSSTHAFLDLALVRAAGLEWRTRSPPRSRKRSSCGKKCDSKSCMRILGVDLISAL